MKKKIFFLIILTIICNFSFAENLRPNIFIENFYQFENNRLNYFQYDAGFSISEYHRNSFRNDLVAQKIEIDFDEKSVKIETEFNRKITLFQTVYVSLDSYFQNNFIALFKEKFAEQIGTIFKEEERKIGRASCRERV